MIGSNPIEVVHSVGVTLVLYGFEPVVNHAVKVRHTHLPSGFDSSAFVGRTIRKAGLSRVR